MFLHFLEPQDRSSTNQATIDSLQAQLSTTREIARELAAALEHVEWLLRKHSESAVLIRDGDISLATIKPHCSIRKGSSARRFAADALAKYKQV